MNRSLSQKHAQAGFTLVELLMALALLKFPEAPADFRSGLIGIMHEEQEHLRLYLGRMAGTGIEFGEMPVSGSFWDALSGMISPLASIRLVTSKWSVSAIWPTSSC